MLKFVYPKTKSLPLLKGTNLDNPKIVFEKSLLTFDSLDSQAFDDLLMTALFSTLKIPTAF